MLFLCYLFVLFSGQRVEPLCSNFRLLRILEQTCTGGLSEVDALLGKRKLPAAYKVNI